MANDNGFFKVPRALTRSEEWKSLSPIYRYVLYTLLELMVYKSTKFFDHGQEILLEPGQLCITIRELANITGQTRSLIERFLIKTNMVRISRQESRHTKTIITLIHPSICECLKNYCETTFETKSRQDRDTKEELNKNIQKDNSLRSLSKKRKPKNENKSLQIEKKQYLEFLSFSDLEYSKLSSQFSAEDLKLMMDKLNNHKGSKNVSYDSDYHTMLGWVKEWLEKKKREETPFQKEKKNFLNNFTPTKAPPVNDPNTIVV